MQTLWGRGSILMGNKLEQIRTTANVIGMAASLIAVSILLRIYGL